MRFFRLQRLAPLFVVMIGLGFAITALNPSASGQETTGGLQGTVKDPLGAVVPNASITVTAPTLVGSKELRTDNAGYYRFANLPPGTYTIVVKASGFETLKRANLVLEVGHLPTVDLALSLGAVNTVVEVKTEGVLIDTTTTTTLTNIPEEVIKDVPHGTSFQSVIQFAPAARNEPLAGSTALGNGSGSSSPGNGSNGGSAGYSIGGGSDSENSYLVEGQETADLVGGYSHTNVPFDFIQEVQLKTSGVEAEYGGALGGVVNVIMDKGTQAWHGSIFSSFQSGAMNGSPVGFSRYDPNSSGCPQGTPGCPANFSTDPTYQNYQPVRPHTSDVFPGFTIGGPLVGLLPKLIADHVYDRMKDRIFLFAGFNPEFNNYEEKLNYGPNGGMVPFSQNTQTYYGYGRVDAEVTQKIRVFGSWLYQLQREAGESLPQFNAQNTNFPSPDSVQGYQNVVTGCQGLGASLTCAGTPESPDTFAHFLGYVAPNTTLNMGADITITNSLVSTTRFGYYFENYHDFGYPTTGTITAFQNNGAGTTDTNGIPLTTSAPNLAQGSGFTNLATDSAFTRRNAMKAIQFDQGLAWFHSGRSGTHNLKFGYQLNRNSDDIFQSFNTPYIQVWPGIDSPYSPQGPTGAANCATVEGPTGINTTKYGCVGTYGTVDVYDTGSQGRATGYNHAFFAQDAWTIGKGVTINAGVRFEHEYLPAENQPASQKITTPINFGWGDKIAPRIGAAWDVFKNGKMKVFGGYGQFFDQMKMNVAISSYGGQYWQECWYALMTPSLSGITPAYNNGRYCVGADAGSQATFAGGTTPSGLVFLENQNLRASPTTCATCSTTEEGTAPGLKPYSQHDSDFGIEFQIRPGLALEGRWDRRRLDHVIEDSAIFNPAVGETFVIVNPGQGVDSTFTGFYSFLYGGVQPDCSVGCPPNKIIPAARSYDGVELRLMKSVSQHWMGMFSYTWSNFRGNYTGLTTTDVADGGGGRNAPNNSRSFDEPFFSWNASGGSSSGLLPTDRPNALKGYVYYDLPWLRRFTTDFGVFQSAYSGSPLTSYLDVGFAFPGAFPTDIVNRGKWIDVTQNQATGEITASAPYTKRTSWYTDTDFNLKQNVKIRESKTLAFDATFSNILNQHAVVSYGQQIDSGYATNFIGPGGHTLFDGLAFYGAAESPYSYVDLMNASASSGGPITVSNQYGKPYRYQLARNIRLGVHFTF